MSTVDAQEFGSCRLEGVDNGPSERRKVEQLGKQCRQAAKEAKAARPRTQFLALTDIPQKNNLQRQMASYTSRRARRWQPTRKRKTEFSKALQRARPHVGTPSKKQKQYAHGAIEKCWKQSPWCSVQPEEVLSGEGSDESNPFEDESVDSESELEMSSLNRLDDCDDEAYHSRTASLHNGSSSAMTEPEFEELDDAFKVRSDQFKKLFDYQKQGVRWMWQLHKQQAGGIIGDEMGLGKTAQVIAFLGGLHASGLYRPSLILCPVTLLCHWLDEIRRWYPWLRTCILHDSMGRASSRLSHKKVIQTAVGSANGILITTYEHLRIYERELLPLKWGYVVLDEGHKIKNPDADITLVVKKLRTRHRLIMTGSPVQNKLTELWSLFDFIFPGKLGTLPVFETEFGIPIQVGGYKNASRLSVATALKCAAILRDAISPYILIRHKHEVDVHLPSKREQVLFCTLSEEQESLYKNYIESPEVESIVQQKTGALAGIDVLRKICNHPDLLESEERKTDYGNASRSGKLKATLEVLKLWKEQGDKVLVFTQTQKMLDILEFHLQKGNYHYCRMDGCTSVQDRDRFIKNFNSDPTIFAFLLTTRVGGLGVSLTGANRVILYDPDWNPSVDIQARERAWRIGQAREVTIYRLLTTGTIEEKIYHRQLFKQLLTDKVLKKGASHKRLFSSKRIRDLFTLNSDLHSRSKSTETETLLKNVSSVKEEEDPILKQLFSQGNVNCALDQKIVENSSSEEARAPVLYQARLTAEEARDRIEVSGNQRQRFAVHFPTWTGRNGAAGAPPSFEKAAAFGLRLPPSDDHQSAGVGRLEAPSSVSLLDKLRLIQDGPRDPSPSPVSAGCSAENASESVPAKSLPVSNMQTFKEKRKAQSISQSQREAYVDDLDAIPREERAKWRTMIIQFFIQRGRAASVDQVKCLVEQISAEKRSVFQSMIAQLATKISSTQRWVLDADIKH